MTRKATLDFYFLSFIQFGLQEIFFNFEDLQIWSLRTCYYYLVHNSTQKEWIHFSFLKINPFLIWNRHSIRVHSMIGKYLASSRNVWINSSSFMRKRLDSTNANKTFPGHLEFFWNSVVTIVEIKTNGIPLRYNLSVVINYKNIRIEQSSVFRESVDLIFYGFRGAVKMFSINTFPALKRLHFFQRSFLSSDISILTSFEFQVQTYSQETSAYQITWKLP